MTLISAHIRSRRILAWAGASAALFGAGVGVASAASSLNFGRYGVTLGSGKPTEATTGGAVTSGSVYFTTDAAPRDARSGVSTYSRIAHQYYGPSAGQPASWHPWNQSRYNLPDNTSYTIAHSYNLRISDHRDATQFRSNPAICINEAWDPDNCTTGQITLNAN